MQVGVPGFQFKLMDGSDTELLPAVQRMIGAANP